MLKPSVRRSVCGERFALDGNWSALCTGRLGGCGCRRHSDLEAATSAWVHWSPAGSCTASADGHPPSTKPTTMHTPCATSRSRTHNRGCIKPGTLHCGGRADGDVRSRDMGRYGWLEIARFLNGVGTCLVVAWLGLSVFWGYTSWSRLGIYVGAAFLVVGLTIVADEHLGKTRTAQFSGKTKTPQVEHLTEPCHSLPVTRTAPTTCGLANHPQAQASRLNRCSTSSAGDEVLTMNAAQPATPRWPSAYEHPPCCLNDR